MAAHDDDQFLTDQPDLADGYALVTPAHVAAMKHGRMVPAYILLWSQYGKIQKARGRGDYAKGSFVTSLAELTRVLGRSRNKAREVLDDLEDGGWLVNLGAAVYHGKPGVCLRLTRSVKRAKEISSARSKQVSAPEPAQRAEIAGEMGACTGTGAPRTGTGAPAAPEPVHEVLPGGHDLPSSDPVSEPEAVRPIGNNYIGNGDAGNASLLKKQSAPEPPCADAPGGPAQSPLRDETRQHDGGHPDGCCCGLCIFGPDLILDPGVASPEGPGSPPARDLPGLSAAPGTWTPSPAVSEAFASLHPARILERAGQEPVPEPVPAGPPATVATAAPAMRQPAPGTWTVAEDRATGCTAKHSTWNYPGDYRSGYPYCSAHGILRPDPGTEPAPGPAMKDPFADDRSEWEAAAAENDRLAAARREARWNQPGRQAGGEVTGCGR